MEPFISLDDYLNKREYTVGVIEIDSADADLTAALNHKEPMGPGFEKFLNVIGKKVMLSPKFESKFTGTLDCKNQKNGKFSYYFEGSGRSIMYHVSTCLPYDPNDRDQLVRRSLCVNMMC